jgi:prepilin-type N-terminal cleavage/methylation domain-containing protein
MNKEGRKREQGFTLIEIIAVLIILGILAAVAVPKFTDLQKQSKIKAAEGLKAAAMSALAMQYSANLLSNPNATDAWTNMNSTKVCEDNVSKDGFDSYTLECSGESTNNYITITVTTPDGDKVDANFTNPNS